VGEVTVRLVDPSVTRALRRQVLRPHWTLEQVAAAETPGGGGLAVLLGGDLVVACASVREEPMPGDPRPGDWRLRGMASDPAVRGQGYGALALTAALDHARAHGGMRVWCNARTPAVGFYERYGFVATGEEFDLPDAGPHYLMWVALPAPEPAGSSAG
jgi:GNAT superfamily N-acetyltransferase